jgi:hypothetical protein
MDRMLSNAAQVAPAPDLQRGSPPAGVESATSGAPRVIGAVGVFATGTAALALLLIPASSPRERHWRSGQGCIVMLNGGGQPAHEPLARRRARS